MALSSTRLTLSGQRFLAHRLERALAGADVHTDEQSPRAQSVSLLTGAVATAAVAGVCAVFTAWQPATALGDARILTVEDSAALYVRVDDVVHPVPNMTSARLIAETAEAPTVISVTALDRVTRGGALGIPGAPALLGTPLDTAPGWMVCDHQGTTVSAGPPTSGPAVQVLAQAPSGQTYLLFDGQRARIDLGDRAVVRALHLEQVTPVVVSAALLDLLPEVAAVATPTIPDLGSDGPSALPGFRVGDVLGVASTTGTDFFVVLAAGVQQVGPVAADVLRSSSIRASITAVGPAALTDLPTVGVLPVAHFPLRDTVVGGGVCASWQDGTIALHAGAPPPGGRVPVRLAGADGNGPALDAVDVPAGRYAYVRTHAGDPAGWLITDLGVRFRVCDADTARILALPAPVAVPRAVLDALPVGPELSRSAALLAHDTAVSP